MPGYICIHGHFYQPPRENPWLEVVELQEATDGYEEHGVGEELADIGLMLLHLAHRYGVDLQTEMIRKFAEVQGDEFVDDGRGYRKRVKR